MKCSPALPGLAIEESAEVEGRLGDPPPSFFVPRRILRRRLKVKPLGMVLILMIILLLLRSLPTSGCGQS